MNKIDRKKITKLANVIKVNDYVEVENKLTLNALSESNIINIDDKNIMYATPLKYNLNNVDEDVNNNFEKKADGSYSAVKKPFNVFAPSTLNEELCISCEEGIYKIDIYRLSDDYIFVGDNDEIVMSDCLRYTDSLGSEKFNIVSKTEGIEANIVIDYYMQTYTFNYKFVLQNLKMNVESGNIVLQDINTDETKYVLRDILAYDKNINVLDGVTYNINEETNEYTLNISLSSNNITQESELFPITIPIKIEKNNDNKFIELSNFRNSFSVPSYNSFYVAGVKDKSTYTCRIFINMENLLNEIIESGETNYKTWLSLHLFKGRYSGLSNKITIYTETSKLDEINLGFDEKVLDIDLTEEVRKRKEAYIQGRTIENLRIDLICKTPFQPNSSYSGYSSLPTSADDNYILIAGNDNGEISYRPQVITTYTPSEIITNETIDFNLSSKRSGNTQIDLLEGTIKHTIPLGSVNSKKLTVGLDLIYDSKEVNDIFKSKRVEGLPYGWRFNLSGYLNKNNDYNNVLGCKDVEYVDGNGTTHILREQWYYKLDGKRHYIPKEKVYIDNDQQIKYYNEELEKVFNVSYEVSNNEGMNYVSINSRLNLIKKNDLLVKERFYVRLGKSKERVEVFLNDDGKILMPFYYKSKDSLIETPKLHELLDFNELSNIFKVEAIDVFNNEINYFNPVEYAPCEFIIDEEGQYYVIYCDNYCTLRHETYGDVFFGINNILVPLEIEKEYEVNKTSPFVDYYENEDIHTINQQINQINEQLGEYRKQLNLYSQNILQQKNNLVKYYHTLELLSNVNEKRNNIENDDNREYYLAIDSQQGHSLFQQVEAYRSEVKNLAINQYSIFAKIQKLEFTLKNLKEVKNYLVSEQKECIQDYIVDSLGNVLGFDYKGKLIYISDKYENEIHINYLDGRIVSIESPTEKMVLHYNNLKQLDYIVSPNGKKIDISYGVQESLEDNNPGHLISKISTRNNNKDYNEINIFYTTEFLIDLIKDSVGNCTKFIWVENRLEGFKQTSNLLKLDGETIEFSSTEKEILDYTIVRMDSYNIELLDNIKNIERVYYLDYLHKIEQIDTIYSNNPKANTHTYKNYHNNLLIQDIEYKDRDLDHIIGLSSYESIGNVIFDGVLTSSEYSVDLSGLRPKEFLVLTLDLNNIKINNLKNDNITFKAIVTDENDKERVYEYTLKKISPRNIAFGFIVNNTDTSVRILIESSNPLNLNELGEINLYRGSGTHYNYDKTNKLIKTENEDNLIMYEDFVDNNPTKVSVIDKFGIEHVITQYFTPDNNLTYIEDDKGNVTEYYYDQLGNIIEEIRYNKMDPTLQKRQKVERDENGNIVKEEGIMKDKNNLYPDTIYSYLPNTSFISSVKHPNGGITCYTRDYNTNEIIEISTDIEGSNNSNISKYRYGLLTSLSSNNNIVNYVYGQEEKITKVKIGDSDYLTVVYDGETNWQWKNTKISYGNIEDDDFDIYYYDKDNKLVQTIDSTSKKIEYTYNDDNLLTLQKAGTEQIEYTYNDELLLISRKFTENNDCVQELFEYDEHNKLENVTYKVNNDIVINELTYVDDNVEKVETSYELTNKYKYDKLNRVIEDDLCILNSTFIKSNYNYLKYKHNTLDLIKKHIIKFNNVVAEVKEYEYDVSGNIIKVDLNENTITYEYDELNRLVRENNSVIDQTTILKYDCNGNIITKRTMAYTTEKEPTGGIKSLYTYDSDNWTDQLINFNGRNIQCDNIGRMIRFGEDQITYYHHGLISSYNTNEYEYNMNSQRSSKTINGITTKYYYAGNKLLKEKSTQKEIEYCYSLDKLIGFVYNGSRYAYEKNIQGDIVRIYNVETQLLAAEYLYDAWGNHTVINYTTDNIGDINPFRYRGYYYDVETQLFYCNSRYYSPELCRWISPDSIEYLDPSSINGLNLYCYCMNNPIMYKDNSGHYPEWATFSNLFEVTSTTLQLMLNGIYIGGYFSVVNAVRPNNIGIGLWNKQRTAAINSFVDDVEAFDKFGKIMAGITVAIQVGEGVFNDYNRGYSLDRIISNAAVNTIVYGGSAWGLAKFGGFVGSFIPIPIVGTAIGTVAGYLLGLGINCLMDLEINGKSLIDHIRDFVYDLWKSIFD